MGGSDKNPFEVLGLSPEIACRLEESDLYNLVRAVYRSLQKVYHPDGKRGRKSKDASMDAIRAVELNLAFEKLNREKNPESFRRCRQTWAARQENGLKKQMACLRNTIRENVEKQTALADGFMQYLLQGVPWNSNNNGEMSPVHLMPSNLKLGLNDVAINQNVRSASWSLGSNYKEIIFDALGAMLFRPVGRAQASPVNYIFLLGSIEVSQIDLVPLLDRVPPRNGFFKSPALDSRYGIDGAPLEVLNTLTMEKFKEYCLPLLQPRLSERSYLFSINRPVFEQSGSISLEGIIVKISSL